MTKSVSIQYSETTASNWFFFIFLVYLVYFMNINFYRLD